MRRLSLVLLTAGLLLAQSAGPTRLELASVERALDLKVRSFSAAEPFYLLGNTRALYLSGVGVLLTDEVNVVPAADISPFRLAYTKDQIAALKAKKADRMPLLRQCMRDQMVAAAMALDKVPVQERVVLATSLFYYAWEDSAGLPRQVVMQAPRRALLTAGKDEAALRAAVKLEEF